MTSPTTKTAKPTEGKAEKTYKAGHTADVVFKAWMKGKPDANLITCFHDTKGLSFLLSHEVVVEEWRYVVQSHVHVVGAKLVAGHGWVSGIEGSKVTTPDWAVSQAPAYDDEVYKVGWSSDPTYQKTLFAGDYRRPTKLA